MPKDASLEGKQLENLKALEFGLRSMPSRLKQVAMVVGPEGSGKSSFVQYMDGQRFSKSRNKLARRRETDQPRWYIFQGTVYVEWHQFQGQTALEQKEANFWLRNIIQHADSVNLLVFADYYSLDTDRGRYFREFLDRLNISSYARNIPIFWLFNKVPTGEYPITLDDLKLVIGTLGCSTDYVAIAQITDEGESALKINEQLGGMPTLADEYIKALIPRCDIGALLDEMRIPQEQALSMSLTSQWEGLSDFLLRSIGLKTFLHNAITEDDTGLIRQLLDQSDLDLFGLHLLESDDGIPKNALQRVLSLADRTEMLKILVEYIVKERLVDPYDTSYRHDKRSPSTSLAEMLAQLSESESMPPELTSVGESLCIYEEGKALDDKTVLEQCLKIEETVKSAQRDSSVHPKIAVLARGSEAALIARHNQHILTSDESGTEASWFETITAEKTPELPGIEILEKAVTTLSIINIFDSTQREQISNILKQVKRMSFVDVSEANFQRLITKFCLLLESLPELKKFSVSYLRPALYLMDREGEVQVPESSALLMLPIEKLKSAKSMYHGARELYEISGVPIKRAVDTYAKPIGKILLATLTLTNIAEPIQEWFRTLLGGGAMENTFQKLLKYFSEKEEGICLWVEHVTELDQIVNTACWKLHSGNELEARKLLVSAVTAIIKHNSQEILSADDKEALLADVAGFVDFSQLMKKSWVRHYPFILIAAQYYDRKNNPDQCERLTRVSWMVRLLHQLSSLKTLSQLHMVSEDTLNFLRSNGATLDKLDRFSQILIVLGVLQKAIDGMAPCKDYMHYCRVLIQKLRSELADFSDFPWHQELLKWLSVAETVMTLYPVLKPSDPSVETLARLSYIKRAEKRLQDSELPPEAYMIFRITTTACYLPHFIRHVRAKEAHKSNQIARYLQEIVLPLSIIWEQHDVTVGAVFARITLRDAFPKYKLLSEGKLTFNACLTPVLDTMGLTHQECLDLKKAELFNPNDSALFRWLATGAKYVEKGRLGVQLTNTCMTVAKQTRSLVFCCNALANSGEKEASTLAENALISLSAGDEKGLEKATAKFSEHIKRLAPNTQMPSKLTSSGLPALGMLDLVASLANIGVTVYYGRKITAKLDELKVQQDEFKVQQAEVLRCMQVSHRELKRIFNRGISEMHEEFASVKNKLALSIHDVKRHQDWVYHEIQQEFTKLKQTVKDTAALANLEQRIYTILTSASYLDKAVKDQNHALIVESLSKLYVDMSNPEIGLVSPFVNGEGVLLKSSPEETRKFLFLTPLFSIANLPNWSYWVKFCIKINTCLKQFAVSNPEPFKRLCNDHLNLIRITDQILSLLNTKNNSKYFIELLSELREHPEKSGLYEHVHLLAEICGIPLHQYGEVEFELWKAPIKGLSPEKIEQKKQIEETIITSLRDSFGDQDTQTVSRFTLSTEELLVDLFQVGVSVFPDFSDSLERKGVLDKTLKALLQNRMLVLKSAAPDFVACGFDGGAAAAAAASARLGIFTERSGLAFREARNPRVVASETGEAGAAALSLS